MAFEAAHPAPLGPETECIARTVFHEASNQALSGQLAVAQVIVNRTHSGEFPTDVCAVVTQRAQFSQGPVAHKSKSWNMAVAIAQIAQAGRAKQVAPGALFFHAAWMTPAWSGERQRVAQIGDHIFYR